MVTAHNVKIRSGKGSQVEKETYRISNMSSMASDAAESRSEPSSTGGASKGNGPGRRKMVPTGRQPRVDAAYQVTALPKFEGPVINQWRTQSHFAASKPAGDAQDGRPGVLATSSKLDDGDRREASNHSETGNSVIEESGKLEIRADGSGDDNNSKNGGDESDESADSSDSANSGDSDDSEESAGSDESDNSDSSDSSDNSEDSADSDGSDDSESDNAEDDDSDAGGADNDNESNGDESCDNTDNSEDTDDTSDDSSGDSSSNDTDGDSDDDTKNEKARKRSKNQNQKKKHKRKQKKLKKKKKKRKKKRKKRKRKREGAEAEESANRENVSEKVVKTSDVRLNKKSRTSQPIAEGHALGELPATFSPNSSTLVYVKQHESFDARGSRMLWNGASRQSDDIRSYLKLARRSGAVSSAGDHIVIDEVGLESDEVGLNVLFRHLNDIKSAEGAVVSASSAGCDEGFLKKNIDLDGRSRRSIVRRTNSDNMLHNISTGKGAPSSRRPIWLPPSKTDAPDHRHSIIKGKGKGKGSISGKALNKKMKPIWSSWSKKVRPLLGVSGRAAKPEFDTLVALLEESYTIPEMIANPGTADYRFFETMLVLKTSLVEQVKKVSAWISHTHSLLSGSSHTRDIGLQDAERLIDQHIMRSKVLGVKPPGLEGLQYASKAICEWQRRAKAVISGSNPDQKIKPTISYLASLIDEAACLPHDPVELQTLHRLHDEAKGLAAYIYRNFPHVSWSPYARLGSTAVARKHSIAAIGDKKIPIGELRNLKKSIASCPIDFPERQRLCEHIDAVDNWIERCKMAMGKDARDLKELSSLANEAEAMPILIGEQFLSLATAISAAQDWMNRVKEAIPSSSKTRNIKGEEHVDISTLRNLLVDNGAAGGKGGTKALANVRSIVMKADDWLVGAKSALDNLKDSTTDELQRLLDDGERIPASMVETLRLKAEIEFRDWTARAKKATSTETKIKKRAAHTDLVEFLEELESIRADLPEQFRSDHKVEMEPYIRKLAKDVRIWNSQVDKHFSEKKLIPIEIIEELASTGKTFPLDLEGRMEQIDSAKQAASEWLKDANRILDIMESGKGNTTESDEPLVWSHEAVTQRCDPNDGRELLTLRQLITMVQDVQGFGISTPQLRSIEAHIKSIQEWLEEAMSMLPKTQRKKGSAFKKLPFSAFTRVCEKTRNLGLPCTDTVLKLCAETDGARRWLEEARDLLSLSNTAMADAEDKRQDGMEADDDGALQMDVIRIYYEDYVELRKKADSGLAVSSQEEALIRLRIDTAEWAESVDTVLALEEKNEHIPLDVAIKLRDQGEKLWGEDDSFGPWPECSPINSDKGGWRMKAHASLLEKITKAAAEGTKITAKLKDIGDKINGGENGSRRRRNKNKNGKKIILYNINNKSEESSLRLSLEMLENTLSQAKNAPCIDIKLFAGLKQNVRRAKAVEESAAKLSRSQEKPSIEQLGKVLDQAHRMSLALRHQDSLAQTYNSAVSWEKRLRESGIESGNAPVEVLKKLLDEGKKIPVDLDAHLQVLETATKEYCICCGPSEGWMIGCEHCDDWFHGRCIGLTEEDNVEDYTCPRCIIKIMLKSNLNLFRSLSSDYFINSRGVQSACVGFSSSSNNCNVDDTFVSQNGKHLDQGAAVDKGGHCAEHASNSEYAMDISINKPSSSQPVDTSTPQEKGNSSSTFNCKSADKDEIARSSLNNANATFNVDSYENRDITLMNESRLLHSEPQASNGIDHTASVDKTVVRENSTAQCGSEGLANSENAAEIAAETALETSITIKTPLNNPDIMKLLEEAETLLVESGSDANTIRCLYRDTNKRRRFEEIQNFVSNSCPACDLTKSVKRLLQIAMWGASALCILGVRDGSESLVKPRHADILTLLESYDAIVSMKIREDESKAVQPLRFMAAEGNKWKRRAEKMISEGSGSEVVDGLTQKRFKEIQEIFSAVLSLPVSYEMEQDLRSVYAQICTRREEATGQHKRKSTNTLAHDKNKRQRNDQ